MMNRSFEASGSEFDRELAEGLVELVRSGRLCAFYSPVKRTLLYLAAEHVIQEHRQFGLSADQVAEFQALECQRHGWHWN